MARPASSSSADSGFVAILAVVFLPAVYIFGAIIALTQFNAMHTLLLQGAAKIRSVPALASVAPFVNRATEHITKLVGPPNKFSPQLTHIILVALMIAVIIHTERSRR